MCRVISHRGIHAVAPCIGNFNIIYFVRIKSYALIGLSYFSGRIRSKLLDDVTIGIFYVEMIFVSLFIGRYIH